MDSISEVLFMAAHHIRHQLVVSDRQIRELRQRGLEAIEDSALRQDIETVTTNMEQLTGGCSRKRSARSPR